MWFLDRQLSAGSARQDLVHIRRGTPKDVLYIDTVVEPWSGFYFL
jgi:homospermidine synthase